MYGNRIFQNAIFDLHGRSSDPGLNFHPKSKRDYSYQRLDRVSRFDDDGAAYRQPTLASELASKSDYLF